jgi:hypothetical protein
MPPHFRWLPPLFHSITIFATPPLLVLAAADRLARFHCAIDAAISAFAAFTLFRQPLPLR